GRKPADKACASFPDACRSPLPGTVLLSATAGPSATMTIEGTCWVDPTGEHQPTSMHMFSGTVPSGCTAEDVDLRRAKAAQLAVAPPQCSIFKTDADRPDDDVSRTPIVTSSGWYALAFAGAPYFQDSRASTWSKVVPSVLDVGLLIGSGVSFGLAVHYRNE